MKPPTGPHSLYRHFDKKGVLLYVGISISAIRRAQQHRASSPWFSDISTMTVELFDTREMAIEAEKRAITEEVPLHNIRRPAKPKIKKPMVPARVRKMKPRGLDNAREVIDKKGARFWSEVLNRPLATVRSWRDRGIPAHVLLDDTAAVRALKRAGYRRGEK